MALFKCKPFIEKYVISWEQSKAKRRDKQIGHQTIDIGPEIENFSPEQWKTVEHIIDVLKPLSIITKYLQRQSITLSDFYGEWLILKYDLKQKIDNQDDLIGDNLAIDLAQNLWNSLGFYSAQLLTNPMLLSATYLDPRFSKTLALSAKTLAKSKLVEIWLRIKKNENSNQSCVLIPNNERIESRSSKLEAMLAAEESEIVDHTIQTNQQLEEQKIFAILSEFSLLSREQACTDVLQYWESNKKAKPELYQLSQVIFVVSPTQVPTERSFSTYAFILSPLRTNLKSEVLENILLINTNKELFKEITADRLEQISKKN